MGVFGRFREKVSEVGAPSHFKATTNERINLMYKEAADFARRLDKCARQVKAVDTATTAMLLCTEDTLSRPMPHVYTMDPEDKTVAPVVDLDSAQESKDQSDKGSMRDVRVKDLRIIAQQQSQKMQATVLTPLNQWLTLFKTFSAKMKALETRRLDFDAERRAFSKLELKRVRQQQATDRVEPELAVKLEARQASLAGKRQEYSSYETEVYETLTSLVKDASTLRVYLAAAMQVQAETFILATA